MQAKRRMLLFGPICIFVVILFLINVTSYIKTIYSLENETNKLNKLYDELVAEGEMLDIEIDKLQDPEYLAKFARENYDYSKDGELIIKINDTNKEVDELTEKEYNNKIILIILSFVLLFMIFMYIFLKSKSGKKVQKKITH